MGKKIISLVRKDAKYLFLAAAASFGFSFLSSRSVFDGSVSLLRTAGLTALLFILVYFAIRLFASAIHRHMAFERSHMETAEANRIALFLFVSYKESVKAIFGVSLTLAWMAGVLFILESFRAQFILVPVFLGLGYSVLLFLLVFSFAAFLDHFRYPFGR